MSFTGTNHFSVLNLCGTCACRVTERGNFSEEVAAYLIKQVLEGVAYLHSKGIVHGDLKLENILLEGTMPCVTVKIADFGLSKVFASSPTRATVCGSPLYMAPELITLDQKRELAPAVDVWSVGVILFILLAGYAPFGARSAPEILELQVDIDACVCSLPFACCSKTEILLLAAESRRQLF